MIHELKPEQFQSVRNLFDDLAYSLVINAVIEGIKPGRVLVDEAENPRTAFLWDWKHRFYLAGYEHNAAFNNALRKLITDEILPELRTSLGLEGFYLSCSPSTWEGVLFELFEDRSLVEDRRRYYLFEGKKAGRKGPIPSGFTLRRVDAELLKDITLRNLGDLHEEIGSEWASQEVFLRDGFGFCLVGGDEIASWCLSEFNRGDKCEAGVYTVREHRRKGFATLTTTALLEHCAANNVTQVGWHCWESNLGSIAVAEKAGFKKIKDYPVYFGRGDEVDNLAEEGDLRAKKGGSRETLNRDDEAFRAGEVEPWVYFNVARAYAALGKREAALKFLEMAVERGWHDVDQMKESEHLASLRASREWRKLLSTLEGETE